MGLPQHTHEMTWRCVAIESSDAIKGRVKGRSVKWVVLKRGRVKGLRVKGGRVIGRPRNPRFKDAHTGRKRRLNA
jgi:hypothetical protein